ncbi:MAG: glycosyltransferase family 2 protein [Cyclobacteriaceae bacterium]|nr:glycosyltransferase family 2 protein [Cyclobacteriaceae bacterium]
MKNLVSIIMPVYNAAKHVDQAIRSVLDQTYSNWELLIINDGSTDNSKEKIQNFQDKRIRYFEQSNQGVSVARNVGLAHMSGDFFCFLDADDQLTKKSIASRILVLERNDEWAFVGGGQEQWDQSLSKKLKTQLPDYEGWPRKGLVSLHPGCFINCSTWLIRREKDGLYHFPVGWTHGEDLAFFLSISKQGQLGLTKDIVVNYRRHASAMSDLGKLQDGYNNYLHFVKAGGYFSSQKELNYLKWRIKRIMFLSYLHTHEFVKAFKSLW